MISVKDRLPETEGEYLTYEDGVWAIESFRMQRKTYEPDDKNNRWGSRHEVILGPGFQIDDPEYGDYTSNPSHWMPLPEAPNEGSPEKVADVEHGPDWIHPGDLHE